MSMFKDCVINENMFGDRFHAVAKVLLKMVRNAPEPVTLRELILFTRRPPAKLFDLCATLQEADMLERDPICTNKWSLKCDRTEVTLEIAKVSRSAARRRNSSC